MIMQLTYDFLVQNNIKTLLDIGANIGHFSRTMRHNIPNLDVFMIEANPFCENMLRSTGIPYEIACLSDLEKQVDLFMNRKNMICTGVSYYQEQTMHYADNDYIKTDTKILDKVIFNKFGHQKSFEFIKMDTQGSELDIIRGGLNTIANTKHIQIETSLIEYNKGSPLKESVVQFMKDLGFKQNVMVEVHYQNQNPETNIIIQEDWIFSR